MAEAKLTTRGQLVIPQSIRQYLHLHPGDRVDFVIQDNGEVIVRPAARDVTELKGILPKPARPVTLAAMDQAVRQRGGKGS